MYHDYFSFSQIAIKLHEVSNMKPMRYCREKSLPIYTSNFQTGVVSPVCVGTVGLVLIRGSGLVERRQKVAMLGWGLVESVEKSAMLDLGGV